jgi:hypothetical protein
MEKLFVWVAGPTVVGFVGQMLGGLTGSIIGSIVGVFVGWYVYRRWFR